jgi:hypothetical protein
MAVDLGCGSKPRPTFNRLLRAPPKLERRHQLRGAGGAHSGQRCQLTRLALGELFQSRANGQQAFGDSPSGLSADARPQQHRQKLGIRQRCRTELQQAFPRALDALSNPRGPGRGACRRGLGRLGTPLGFFVHAAIAPLDVSIA